ncbi:hypothetical protein AUO94_00495 [Planococcus kocurii]|uniref:DUF4935 domain-containing protein n=1 Tax=Planococcus kocurii TaxID=1374 RepID=A0ABM5WSB8_9BACL|nr:PIN domain-containing protein [Planococcus kocurii]ALS77212.1 hypothetical protein AUO94_00495 [Planococcus kocurii]
MDKQNALVVDTNILIDFLEPGKYSEDSFYTFLMRLNGFTHLMLPQQVLAEWNHLKNNKIQQYEDQILLDFIKYNDLLKYVPEQHQKEELLHQLNTIRKISLRAYRYTYAVRAKHIDRIINSFAVIIERNPDIDRLVVDFAIEQQPPFFSMELKKDNTNKKSSKNESTDAVIFFTIIDYLKKHRNNYNKVAFLSCNSKDFSEPNNPSKIHSNLEKYIEEVEVEFFNNLKAAQKLLKYNDTEEASYKNLVKIIVTSNADRYQYLTDEYFCDCKNPDCDNEVHINSDSILMGQYYHLRCPKCEYTWDTGDHISTSMDY